MVDFSQRSSRRIPLPPYALWESRAGAGTPVALIHGLSGSMRWWSKNIDALARKHLVAAVDLTGFGRNRRFVGLPSVMPSFAEVTSLLARWLESFGEPVHLIGHSMGGALSIRLAAERPDLVRSLILVNSAGMPFRLDPRPHVRPLPKPPYGGPGIARVLLPDFLRAGPASVAVAGTRVIFSDEREQMHRIRVPALLVWGENDPLVPLQYGQAMQHEIADATLAVIPRAAHVAMWDAPAEFNEIVLKFLEDVDARPVRAPVEPSFAWGIAGWSDGVAHRQAGRRRDFVLVHGLGMSSAYFEPLARELFARGFHPIAPDLPGFGESDNARAGDPDEQARLLAAWADAMLIRDAVWLGHSIGCNTVAALARSRPDLVRRCLYLGAVWTRASHPTLRLFAMLALDALREPLSLYRYVLPAYWRVGLARWWSTWRRFRADILAAPPDGTFLAGERDPIADRRIAPVQEVPGAHACNVSHARAVADAIVRNAPSSSVLPSPSPGNSP
ncbi:MAG TPA: alpha/beta fold hydrolase [Thermoanaerobaculia bacterium]|nr:alpha/beta fold hydrolase [Thermoanaerobaculia bacterium]